MHWLSFTIEWHKKGFFLCTGGGMSPACCRPCCRPCLRYNTIRVPSSFPLSVSFWSDVAALVQAMGHIFLWCWEEKIREKFVSFIRQSSTRNLPLGHWIFSDEGSLFGCNGNLLTMKNGLHVLSDAVQISWQPSNIVGQSYDWGYTSFPCYK